MDQPEENRLQTPAEGENPYRFPSDQPPEVSVAIAKGILTGAAISFILGIALAIYFILSETDLTWIDWLVRLLMTPVVLAIVGGFVGGSVAFCRWLSSRINQ